MNYINRIILGDAYEILKQMPDAFVHTCITSPPYWGLRDYGVNGQLGLEDHPIEYIEKLYQIFSEVKRVLVPSGTIWIVIGDCYAGSGKGGNNAMYQRKHTQFGQNERKERLGKVVSAKSIGLKPKDLVGLPWMLAFKLRDDGGWYFRDMIIWDKGFSGKCEPVQDRPTTSHEYILLFSKSKRYYYDCQSIKIKSKNDEFINRRSVWQYHTDAGIYRQYAAFPEKLIEPMIMAGSPAGGTVLDPFMGSGTTAKVALDLGRKFVGTELNPEYKNIAGKRLLNQTPSIFEEAI